MRFLFSSIARVSQTRSRSALQLSRPFSASGPYPPKSPSSFGIAFDIDGVILRGRTPIGDSVSALRRLYTESGSLQVPFLFLTNGGGIPESKRAHELSKILEVPISPQQVVQGHSPFKELLPRYERELVVAVGKGEPALVMSEYGFKRVLSIDDYSSYFDGIDPLSEFKNWKAKVNCNGCDPKDAERNYNVLSDEVKAVFVASDPIDWSRDVQVLCDILGSGGLPGKRIELQQPSLYFANDDLEYQSVFPVERLGMGAFRIALESIYNRVHHCSLQFASYGKPNPLVFRNAETILQGLGSLIEKNEGSETRPFTTIYMVGDNPSVDIHGAQQAGPPWLSILTRTGVFRGEGNHFQFPADLVVDTVSDAVDYILTRELP